MNPSEEQRLLRESAAAFFRDRAPVSRLRKSRDSARNDLDIDLWREISDMGRPTIRSYRNTARVARNAVSQEAIRVEREGKPFEAIAYLVKGARRQEGLISGDIEREIWTAGLMQGLIKDVLSAGDLIQRIVQEANEILGRRLAAVAA